MLITLRSILLIVISFAYTFPVFSKKLEIDERESTFFSEEYDNKINNEDLITRIKNDPSLENYLKLLLKKNSGLKSAFDEFKASVQKITQAKFLPDPKLSYTNFIEEIQTRTGPQTYKVSLSQTFPWFGKLKLKEEIFYNQSEILWQNILKKRLDLIYGFKKNYYEYAYLNQLIQITKNTLMLLKQLEPIIQTKVQSGDNQKDLIRLQVEIAKLENELISLNDKRPALNRKLLALMNINNEIILPWPVVSTLLDAEIDFSFINENLRKDNPLLKEIEEQIELSENKLKLSKTESMPDISLGITYINTDNAVLQNISGSGDDPFGVNITMNIPIWIPKYKANTEEYKLMISSYKANFQDIFNQLRANLEIVIYGYKDIRRQIELYQNSLIPKAKQALKLNEIAYISGKSSLLDLIDSQRTLLQFENIFWRNLTKYHQILSEIEKICGGNVYE